MNQEGQNIEKSNDSSNGSESDVSVEELDSNDSSIAKAADQEPNPVEQEEHASKPSVGDEVTDSKDATAEVSANLVNQDIDDADTTNKNIDSNLTESDELQVEKGSEEPGFSLQNIPQQTQKEMHFAVIAGEPLSVVPKDLYIPPDALEVFLEAFEGPLDLLLYLIKRQNVDILNIPIAHITEQYMAYVDLMKSVNLELAAEYLVMAAMLAEIKSRVLLPRPSLEEDEDDPRADLIRRLQEYERFKKAAQDVDELPRMGRETFQVETETPELHINKPLPDVDMREVLLALKDVLVRAEMFTSHQIQREALSTREKMATVLAILSADNFTDFISLFNIEEGRAGVVVTFLAIMELTKEMLIEIVQSDPFSPIHVRARIGPIEPDYSH